jgi:hypothetical protein
MGEGACVRWLGRPGISGALVFVNSSGLSSVLVDHPCPDSVKGIEPKESKKKKVSSKPQVFRKKVYFKFSFYFPLPINPAASPGAIPKNKTSLAQEHSAE